VKVADWRLKSLSATLVESLLQCEAVSSELFDVTRLQGALLYDDLLVSAVAGAREKLEGLYSSDSEP
jgi:hypothetical protein